MERTAFDEVYAKGIAPRRWPLGATSISLVFVVELLRSISFTYENPRCGKVIPRSATHPETTHARLRWSAIPEVPLSL
jgi:hypothetical protein